FILPKAVLTPSAKDEIRKRRIKIAVRLDSRSVADNSGETACIESDSVNVTAFIGSRVVSAADIQTQPGSVRTLFILPKAVLTPSAKDEIRKRRITIAVQ
ncbi:MAG: hypothetical protein LBT89_04130, partial [Planctomycetaceae bacterium]|nr:hypothetical protein [Planctomycetaceae bacterium]